MKAAPSPFRRLALTLARHAARVLPCAPSSWAQAMRHELDYIADDKAALRWAFGCMLASYKARLTHRPRFGPRIAWRHVATSGALMLLIGLALQEHAASQTEPPRPAVDETTCDLPGVSPEIRPRLRCGSVPRNDEFPLAGHNVRQFSPCGAKIAADFIDHPAQEPETSCTDRTAPIPFHPKRR
jgi:hypothetical protein